MQHVKLIRDNGLYDYKGSSSIEMAIIGLFLKDVGCDRSFRKWAISKDDTADYCGCNTTFLEKKGESIFLEDAIIDEKEIPNRLEISRQQFVQLLDDWQEKICVPRPKEVIIKYENDQYSIETNN